MISAPEIAGLVAATHGGPALAQTVPEIAPTAVTVVTLVAELLALVGSCETVATETVLVTVPLAAVTFTTSVSTTFDPLAMVPSEQVIVPVPFTAGVVQPAFGVRLWNVVPVGIVSVRVVPLAGSGPPLWTAIEYVRFVPLGTGLGFARLVTERSAVAAARSAVTRATNDLGQQPPMPGAVACAPPPVPGKFEELVNPATYTSPDAGWIARARAVSPALPPRYVA